MRLTRLATAITLLERPIDSARGERVGGGAAVAAVVRWGRRGAHGPGRGGVGGRGRRSVGATSSGAATRVAWAAGPPVRRAPRSGRGPARLGCGRGRGPRPRRRGGRWQVHPRARVRCGPRARLDRRPRARRGRGRTPCGRGVRRSAAAPGPAARPEGPEGCRGRPLRGRPVRRPGAVAGDRQADGRVGGLLDRGRRPRRHPRRRAAPPPPHPAPDPPGREQHEESARDRRQPRGDGAVGGGAHLQVAGRPEHPTVRGAHHRVHRELPRPRDLRVHRHLAAAERRDLLDVDRRDPQPGRALELHPHPHGDGQRVGRP